MIHPDYDSPGSLKTFLEELFLQQGKGLVLVLFLLFAD